MSTLRQIKSQAQYLEMYLGDVIYEVSQVYTPPTNDGVWEWDDYFENLERQSYMLECWTYNVEELFSLGEKYAPSDEELEYLDTWKPAYP